jgi:hypothetical protein
MLRRDIGDWTTLHFTQCHLELCDVTDRFFNLARSLCTVTIPLDTLKVVSFEQGHVVANG